MGYRSPRRLGGSPFGVQRGQRPLAAGPDWLLYRRSKCPHQRLARAYVSEDNSFPRSADTPLAIAGMLILMIDRVDSSDYVSLPRDT